MTGGGTDSDQKTGSPGKTGPVTTPALRSVFQLAICNTAAYDTAVISTFGSLQITIKPLSQPICDAVRTADLVEHY